VIQKSVDRRYGVLVLDGDSVEIAIVDAHAVCSVFLFYE
jgi:hypothetical protein